MAVLNEKNKKTEKVIHIMITDRCNRDCKYCCNKQYDMNDIPRVTEDELKKAKVLCLTGGEPFAYACPAKVAQMYKDKYPNVKKVYVYTNAIELDEYLGEHPKEDISYIDGLNVSIKCKNDIEAFRSLMFDRRVKSMKSNLLYVFSEFKGEFPKNKIGNFKIVHRVWQKDFVPADDSIFRRI